MKMMRRLAAFLARLVAGDPPLEWTLDPVSGEMVRRHPETGAEEARPMTRAEREHYLWWATK